MTRIFSLFVCLLVFLPVSIAAHAEEFEVKSDLTAATVYSNRATLTRRAVVEIPAGDHTVVFTGLPANLLPDSLRASGSAAANVVFGALTHKQEINAELIAPREKELNEQLEILRDKRNLIEAEKQALGIKKNFLSNLSRQAELRTNEDIAEINLKPDQWAAAADTVHSGFLEAQKAGIGFDIEIRKIDKEVDRIQRELNLLRTDQRSTYKITIPLQADKATKLSVELDYQVPSASWRPLYDARLETEKGELEMIQYGAVRQTTGEDWSNIALTLSTAQPQRGASLPPLTPMWVNIWEARYKEERAGGFGMAAQSVTKAQMMAPAAVMSEESLMYADAAAPMEKDAEFRGAEIETGGFVSEYKIPGPSSVTSDGSESKLLIGKFETESQLEIHIKPQLSNEAMLVVNTRLVSSSPVLPGQVSLFRDGAYVGQVHTPMLRQGETQYLGFGVDDQVSVTRRVLKDEKGEAGLIGKDSTLERHFLSEIKNLHDRSVDIKVFQTVPVSQDERIKVEMIANQTTPGYETDYDNVKGLLRWSIKPDAQQTSNIKLGWKVSWPSDTQIGGL